MNRTTEYSETSSKKGRGRAKKSLDLIEAMRAAAAAAHPITGRGIGYKLFTAGLIPSMARAEMQRVYRLLTAARERGEIPWEWIVDETRALERCPSWDDPADFALTVSRATAATSGRNSRPVSRFGVRRAPCAACSDPCSTSMASASG